MKVLRIKLTQSQASYTREETVNNRMTYPFPPYSTIIGALHNACGYTTYHPMDISVQGRYGAMQKEIYVNHTLLNSTMDDRGILVWLCNSNSLNTAYVEVAEAQANGSSFESGKTIRVINEPLLQQYRDLKEASKRFDIEKKEMIDPLDKRWKEEKKKLKSDLKALDKKSEAAQVLKQKIAEEDRKMNEIKEVFADRKKVEVEEPYRHFRTLTKAPWTQEVLYDLEWVIHVRAEEEILADIVEHQYDFVSLGRSEDFVEIQDVSYVEMADHVEEEYALHPGYGMLVHVDHIDSNYSFSVSNKEKNTEGTLYYVAKDYQLQNGKREFRRIPCVYSSGYVIDDESEKILFDGTYFADFN